MLADAMQLKKKMAKATNATAMATTQPSIAVAVAAPPRRLADAGYQSPSLRAENKDVSCFLILEQQQPERPSRSDCEERESSTKTKKKCFFSPFCFKRRPRRQQPRPLFSFLFFKTEEQPEKKSSAQRILTSIDNESNVKNNEIFFLSVKN